MARRSAALGNGSVRLQPYLGRRERQSRDWAEGYYRPIDTGEKEEALAARRCREMWPGHEQYSL